MLNTAENIEKLNFLVNDISHKLTSNNVFITNFNY